MDTNAERHYRRLLAELLARMQPEIASMMDSVQSGPGGQSGGELSDVPFHLGDEGTDEFLRDMAATLLQNEDHIAAEVRSALHRLDHGKFGICESCRVAIPKARLDAIPYARFCVKCAELADQGSAPNFNQGLPSKSELLAEVGEMGERRRDRQRQQQSAANEHNSPDPDDADRHAAGTAGGGTSVGGLAGTTIGHGDPDVAIIEDATASSEFDSRDARQTSTEERQA
jgi:RNA polymerase-binding transcription factor DksA